MDNKPSASASKSTRREFFTHSAAVAAVSSSLLPLASRAKDKPVPKVTGRVLGANDRINVGFIGAGMQFHALIERGFFPRQQAKNDFQFAAVCDVWQPRLKHGQERTKAEKTFADFSDLLAQKDIDGVVIAVPDHWHYLMASQAMAAGKDVYLEKPMTYTVEEAAKLNDEAARTGRVMQIGGTGPAQRIYQQAYDYIKAGKMGKVVWGLISYNRNTDEGMWDYPIPGVGSTHWPDAEVSPGKNLDWKMWLGPAPKRRFSNERYFRWRKYWDYSGGNATDLLFHRLGAMSTMLGFDFPVRVTGAGGIYVQKNREVPDTYMTMIEYPGEYCVNMISCMANSTSVPLTVYGNWGTLQITAEQTAGDSMGDQTRGPRQRGRRPEVALIKAERQFLKQFQEANEGKTEVTIQPEQSEDLVDNWLNCMRTRQTTVYNALRGYQVMTAIKLGVDSYRQGRVMAFDPSSRRILKNVPLHKEYLPPDA